MKLLKTFLFFLCVFLLANVKANTITDSLERLLPKATDSLKVKLLSDLCWEYRFISPDTALIYGNRALNLANELNYPKGVAQAYNDMGIIYIDKSLYDSAISYFKNAMKIREKLNDQTGIASLYNKLGIIFQKQGNLKEALQNQLAALKIYEALDMELWMSYCLNNIAIVHFNLGNFNKSLEYHREALKYRKKLGNSYGIAASYGNIANVNLSLKDTASAISYYEKALKTFREMEYDEGISTILSNLGNIYLVRKQNRKALEVLKESLVIREKMGDQKAISSSLIKMGEAYGNMGEYDNAFKVLYRGLQIAQKINVVEEEISAYLNLAKLYSLTGKSDSSYVYTSYYIALKDSVYEQRLQQQIVGLQIKYETEKIEKDNQLLTQEIELKEARLKQRNTTLLLLVFLVIFIIGVAAFLIYRRNQKQKAMLDNEIIRHNEEQLKAVIDSQEKERRHIARELHDSVGQRLAAIKLNWENVWPTISGDEHEKMNKMAILMDDASKEVRAISHQMMPKELEQFGLIPAINNLLETALKNDNTQFEFNHFSLPDRLDSTIELNLYRVIQELVSNVIKHAAAGSVHLQLLKRNNNLVLIFEDDGKGFVSEPPAGGIGLANIKSRVKVLNGTITYESSPGNGTTIRIRIPLNE